MKNCIMNEISIVDGKLTKWMKINCSEREMVIINEKRLQCTKTGYNG